MGSKSESTSSPQSWFVYLARCADGTLYAGITTDPVTRAKAHNAGRGAAYTRSRLPIEMVLIEPATDRPAALRREAAIRRLNRVEKIRLIADRAVGNRTSE
ncbi:MAG: GIY-YIG nuclease family protein [Gemmatimonadota bacterium]